MQTRTLARVASISLFAACGAAAHADVMFSGSGLNPEVNSSASGSATFKITGNTLTITLLNTTAPRTGAQGNALTGVVFNVTGAAPTLTLSGTSMGSGSALWTSRTASNAAASINGSWTSTLGSSPLGMYGAATTGFAGAFNGGSMSLGNSGANYGLVAPGTFTGSNSVSFGGAQYPFVQGSIVLTFTGASGINESQIIGVRLLFGTSGEGSITIIPAPGSFGAVAVAGLLAARRRR